MAVRSRYYMWKILSWNGWSLKNILLFKTIIQKQKLSLNLDFDENDILRSQTRINQIKGVVLQENQPILLRSNSYFTELIVLKCHNEVKRSGLESTLNRIRSNYWLIKGQSTVKSIIRKCVTCRLIQAKCVQSSPTPLLPEHRVSCNFPFQCFYAGPFISSRHLFKICRAL